jgi:hypothetical protein
VKEDSSSACARARQANESRREVLVMDSGCGQSVEKVEGGRWKVEAWWKLLPGGTEPTPLRHGCITIVAVALIPGTGDEDADEDADPNADAYRDDPAILLLIRGVAPRSGLPQDGHIDAEPHSAHSRTTVEGEHERTPCLQRRDRSNRQVATVPACLDGFEPQSDPIAQARGTTQCNRRKTCIYHV